MAAPTAPSAAGGTLPSTNVFSVPPQLVYNTWPLPTNASMPPQRSKFDKMVLILIIISSIGIGMAVATIIYQMRDRKRSKNSSTQNQPPQT
jgi:hypothetical protein